jgi:hypothetical protein
VSVGFVETFDDLKHIISEAWNELAQHLSFAKQWIAAFLQGQDYYCDLRR